MTEAKITITLNKIGDKGCVNLAYETPISPVTALECLTFLARNFMCQLNLDKELIEKAIHLATDEKAFQSLMNES
jgi:hypothetical protein